MLYESALSPSRGGDPHDVNDPSFIYGGTLACTPPRCAVWRFTMCGVGAACMNAPSFILGGPCITWMLTPSLGGPPDTALWSSGGSARDRMGAPYPVGGPPGKDRMIAQGPRR